mmetsp:Transcript_18672/g.40125  ORF Transcript_18672/g.40125 Transcript_18672/m.40125 type:complete len:309 (-) Transcript_18672:3809-4735(-)
MRRGMRLITASSRSMGRLVAPSTSTRSFWRVRRPSQQLMNSFLILRMASCSLCLSLLPSSESTSSRKMTVGAILCAIENSARTCFSPSPNHLDARLDMEQYMKFAPDSEATAFASIVLPVPGGPNSSTPLVGLARLPRMKSSGRFMGSITSSCSVSFTLSRAPMSSKLTPTSSGGTTSDISRFSNSLSSGTSFREGFELVDFSMPTSSDRSRTMCRAAVMSSALRINFLLASSTTGARLMRHAAASPSSFSACTALSAACLRSTTSSSGHSMLQRDMTAARHFLLACSLMVAMSRSIAAFQSARAGSC